MFLFVIRSCHMWSSLPWINLVCEDSSSIDIVWKCFQQYHYTIFFWRYKRIKIFSRLLLMHIAWIMEIYLHLSLFVHIVLPVLNNGSPKGSLGPFYSNLGYGLLANRLMHTLKDVMKLIITLFNQINCDKDYILNNNMLRFYAFGGYLEIKRHFEIWADYNFATKAFLHLWRIDFHLNNIADFNHKKTHGIWKLFILLLNYSPPHT